MAATLEAQALSEAHRAAQARNAAVVALIVQRYWRTVSPEDLAASARVWIEAVLPAILGRRAISASLAARYMEQFRVLELGPTLREQIVFRPPEVTPDIEEMIRTSLAITGPVALRKRLGAIEDTSPERAVREALATSGAGAAAAAVRHVQNGGRDLIADEIVRSRVGFVRVTRADPCYFCAMLASRGPVYKSDSFDRSDPRFADGANAGNYKVHDSCGCHLEPVYRTDQLDKSKEFSALWSASTAGKSGQAAVNAFRQAYEGRVR